jgi:hypothetical protein
VIFVVRKPAKKEAREDAWDIVQGEKEGGDSLTGVVEFASECWEIGLWETVSCALKGNRNAIDVYTTMVEKSPRYTRGFLTAGRHLGRVYWHEANGEQT